VTIAAQVATSHDDNHDRAQYPVPRWKPRDGFHVDRALLYGLMRQESRFEPVAHNPSGASGLMQLMPGTARELGADPKIPEQNVDAGTRYLRDLLLKYDNQAYHALAAYNAGPGAVDKYHGVPPYRETQNYILNVLRNWKKQSPTD
jgi:soluble lytic murein transglycosylase-like protein